MSDIDTEFERRVRERAYRLWQESGTPEGRSDEFWHEARRLEEALRGGASGAPDARERGRSALDSATEALTKDNIPTHRGVV